jgi:hypothetical protein
MSATGVAISCVAGAVVFAWAYATSKPARGDDASDDALLSAKVAAITAGAFGILAFMWIGAFGGATLQDVLLAELAGPKARRVVYFAYGSLTVSLLSFVAFAIHRLRGPRGGA